MKKLVEVRNLKKYFPGTEVSIFRAGNDVKAVDGVSFDIYEQETLGLVGETGCGKTTVGRTMLHLYQPTAGNIIFDGVDLNDLGERELRFARSKMQMIFQDPYASLNPRMTVGSIVGAPLDVHTDQSRKEKGERVQELLDIVGLNPDFVNRYPHEFSGGQRQRIGIARALALNPDFVVCDEPISSLDVSIQAQVVNLLEDLQKKLGLTYLFIAHDLSMVRHISDRMAVMYLGKIVELADRDEIFLNSLHPYTQALMSAVPVPDPDLADSKDRIILDGDIPNPSNPPLGCNFNTRCP
ncbi:MAG: ATP-binding cassette domain-containing protein, partial [Anaerolineales bacterium]|nr:ATP-binding cassette domain-containing protein [Anaerolineales bacterium]